MEERIVKELKSKPVYYLKADKGNKIVITNRSDCVMEKLENGKFHELRTNPLPDSIKRIEKTQKECSYVIENPAALRTTDPCLPRIRYLPKIHKSDNEIQILLRFNELELSTGKPTIRNREELVEKLGNTETLSAEEGMVSFDTKALLTSILVKEALTYLEEKLININESSWEWRRKVFFFFTLCAVHKRVRLVVIGFAIWLYGGF